MEKQQVKNLLYLMARSHLNQTELAKLLGVKRQTVNNWIRRRGVIPPRNLARLPVVLGTKMEELTEGNTPEVDAQEPLSAIEIRLGVIEQRLSAIELRMAVLECMQKRIDRIERRLELTD